MSIFICDYCHEQYDNDYVYCEEIEGKVFCDDCIYENRHSEVLMPDQHNDQQESK